MSFVHLHLHSSYSVLDGFCKIKDLVARVKEMGMPAVALTDHGTMFGTMEFFNAARKEGIKPIIGLETYLAARSMQDRDVHRDKRSSHLILLAENMTGYRNLLKIATASQLEGFYYTPRIDRAFLAKHSEGLIATSACMSGDIPRAILDHDDAKAERNLLWYLDVFGKDRFFLELQHHEIPELPMINQKLLEIGKKHGAKFVATNDVHYIDPEDGELQDILLAVQMGRLLTDPDRKRMSGNSYYLRSPEEMKTLFAEVPEAITNTLWIAERCNVDLKQKGYHLPQFEVPEGYTTASYLRHVCEQGLQRRMKERSQTPDVRERFERELSVISQMGFEAYFLIVWDLCRYARENGIWYNARGSAAGSLVAYGLDITLVDPIEHGLIFERFLNTGRVSMPDIDLDFQDDRRGDMMEYCARKFGEDKVAQIITFGTMAARGAIRDVGRVMDIPLPEVDRVAKMIPNIPGKPVSIASALKESHDLEEAHQSSSYMERLIDTASRMEGSIRNVGTHAAGVIITDRPITEYIPLHRPTNQSENLPIKVVSQYEMAVVDELGLLKVDFLGLVTLTIMSKACELIFKRHGIRLDLDNIPINDPEVYRYISEGHTTGLFQLEGSGMTRYIIQMQPTQLSHVIAMIALFRPGPMDIIPEYIERMHGKRPVTYLHEKLEPIFKETFGYAVYQEQIMQAAMQLGGYAPNDADDLRRAIAKKKGEQVLRHRKKFVEGAQAGGIDANVAEEIFSFWESFAHYGFNKSHAADYGVIAVQTGYLKLHFPVEYMTALLSAWKNDIDKVANYVLEVRNMGIEVLPPDVNSSGFDFEIEDYGDGRSAIRFGLGAIKNVGQNPVDLILTARKTGPFKDLTDFSHRVDLRQLGRRTLECLIRVGGLDSFGSRLAILQEMDRIISISSAYFKAAEEGQLSLFGSHPSAGDEIALSEAPYVDLKEQLAWEKELMGLYISDHPMNSHMAVLQKSITHASVSFEETPADTRVVVGGMVTRFRQHFTKNNKTMGFATIEDVYGQIELVLFPQAWEKYAHLLEVDRVVLVEGKLDKKMGDPKILVDRLRLPDTDEKASDRYGEETDFEDMHYEHILEHYLPDISKLRGIIEVLDEQQNDKPGLDELDIELNENWTDEQCEDEVTREHLADPLEMNLEDQDQEENIALNNNSYEQFHRVIPGKGIKEVFDSSSLNVHNLVITLESCGDQQRDRRRISRIHGILASKPGSDHFSFKIIEQGKCFILEFPNSSTTLDESLITELNRLLGDQNVVVF